MLSVAIIGEESTSLYISHKCAALTKYYYSAKRALAPLIYKSISLYELHNFFLDCDIYFDIIKEHMVC
jgi:hypothetical protein